MPRTTKSSGGGGGSAEARGLAVLRILIGVFFIAEGLSKINWLFDTGPLSRELSGYLTHAPTWSRWYLEHFAIPGTPLFARLVMLGEFGAGIALVCGFWTRLVAFLALAMVLNFHVASGAIFKLSFLRNGYGLPVVGSLAALAIGGARLPWGVKS
jgi:uncharacterized membrane protein YphA (DoxX/SURF4 family)